ncbi:MAG TPA: hypothetical protein VMW50_02160 [Dehalococcoidia bacterium]|nr:hypothetical protein [Dehalococcoidia bacterium]
MGDKKYKNYGAYCLILYRCDICGKQEMVWNSRDGDAVSPIECRRHDFFCGLMWRDQKSPISYVPNFDPSDTSRVLISKKSSNDTMVISGKEYKAMINNRQVPSVSKGEDKMKIEITEKGESVGGKLKLHDLLRLAKTRAKQLGVVAPIDLIPDNVVYAHNPSGGCIRDQTQNVGDIISAIDSYDRGTLTCHDCLDFYSDIYNCCKHVNGSDRCEEMVDEKAIRSAIGNPPELFGDLKMDFLFFTIGDTLRLMQIVHPLKATIYLLLIYSGNVSSDTTEAKKRVDEVLSKLDEIERVKLEPVSLLLPKLEAEKEKLFALYAKNEEIVRLERGKALRSMGAFSKDINNERTKLLERKDEVEAMVDQLKLIIEKAESDIPQESRTVKLKSVLKYFLVGGFIFIVFLKDPTISLYLAVLVVLAWLTDRYIT